MRAALTAMLRLLDLLAWIGQEFAQLVAWAHMRARRWVIKQLSKEG